MSVRWSALARLLLPLLTMLALAGPIASTPAATMTDDQPPPPNAIVLFDGTSTAAWRQLGGDEPICWPVIEGALVVRGGCGDVRTIGTFGDFRLHLEFWSPASPADAAEQERGNSGVYLQQRYELQVLDSFGRALSGRDDAGAIYGVKDADVNAAQPAETWQRYDVTFRAARWSSGVKTAPARVTVLWNDTLVHDDVELPSSTAGGALEGPDPGPILLQDHGDPVRYRHIWIEPLP